VDLKQAFDSVPRELVYRALKERGVPQKVIDMVKELYRTHAFKVRKDGEEAQEKTTTTRGLKQGCPLSPILFNIVLEHVLQQVDFGAGLEFQRRETGNRLEKKPKKRGRKAEKPETRKLTHLLFADDIVGLAATREGLEAQLQSMSDVFKRHGLTINKKKTKWQKDDAFRETKQKEEALRAASATAAQSKKMARTSGESTAREAAEAAEEKIRIDGEEIERVEKFVYLGAVFNERDDDVDDLARRMQQGNKSVARIRKVLCYLATPADGPFITLLGTHRKKRRRKAQMRTNPLRRRRKKKKR
jgi:hypothetical protein